MNDPRFVIREALLDYERDLVHQGLAREANVIAADRRAEAVLRALRDADLEVIEKERYRGWGTW